MAHILIFSSDRIFSENNSSSAIGIRTFEIAKALVKLGNNVKLAEYNRLKCEEISGVSFIGWNYKTIGNIRTDSDVCIIPQIMAEIYFKCSGPRVPTIVDLIAPVQLELLSINLLSQNIINPYYYSKILYGTALALSKGDFFICGGERQRYYYIGMLTILGRINPITYYTKIIDLVPQAATIEKIMHTKNIFRNKIIDTNDKVILWAGGIYPWYDAEILIKAMRKIIDKIPNAKLIFVGAKNPDYNPSFNGYVSSLDLAKRLGLLDKNIFFIDWLPYNERQNMYLESDIAISLHKNNMESELSFRTRIVDFLWGGLPVVVNQGDEMSEYIEKYEAGKVVEIGNQKMLEDVIIDILLNKDKQKNMSINARKIISEKLNWNNVVDPIHNFCNNPIIAEDLTNKIAKQSYLSIVQPKFGISIKIKNKYYLAKKVYYSESLKNFIKVILQYLARKLTFNPSFNPFKK